MTGEDIFERALDWGFESPYEYIMEVLQENLVKQKEGTAYNFKTADGGLKKVFSILYLFVFYSCH